MFFSLLPHNSWSSGDNHRPIIRALCCIVQHVLLRQLSNTADDQNLSAVMVVQENRHLQCICFISLSVYLCQQGTDFALIVQRNFLP